MADFSRTPLVALIDGRSKGYVGVHVEQGVPVLDRDLNLLNDLVSTTVRSVVSRYVGSGVPLVGDGFRIVAIPANNDFRIAADAAGPGIALVGGIEVTIPADTTYGAQGGVPALTTPTAAQPNPRIDTVYIDVSLRDVEGTEDADLLNLVDVGMQTSVRQAATWVVRVAEGLPVPTPADGHIHYPLARVTRPLADPTVQASMIADLREPMAPLTDLERRLRLVELLLLTPAFHASPNQFNPKFGAPGANVTLSGRNFDVGAAEVSFGTTTASIVGAPTSSQIVARVPAMSPGPVPISVVTLGGTATSDDLFTVLPQAPVFDAAPNEFNPKFGPPGTNVTLFGTNFNVGTVAVRFGTTPALIAGTPTPTQIVAIVPAMSPGATTITVQTGAGSDTTNDPFTVV
jgi:hypothetical protein